MAVLTFDDRLTRARRYLTDQLVAGRYGFSCLGSDDTPRFSDKKGHVFTGYFIAEALAGLMNEIERSILLVRILSEENEGLWGFSPPAPYISPEHEVFVVDADDTAYVLRTLRTLGVNRLPRSLLAFLRPDDKLFVTFNAPGRTRLASQPAPDSNLLAHPEVNANVFLALKGTRLESHINWPLVAECQLPDGSWPSFFYPSRVFATRLFLELIGDQAWLAEPRARGLAFLEATQQPDGSWGDVYDTALATLAMAACRPGGEHMTRACAYLLETQADDGGWQTNRCIWEFHADPTDVWRAYDTHGTLVSALCTMALRSAIARGA